MFIIPNQFKTNSDEISNVKPINYYGFSKREGEKHIEKSKMNQ